MHILSSYIPNTWLEVRGIYNENSYEEELWSWSRMFLLFYFLIFIYGMNEMWSPSAGFLTESAYLQKAVRYPAESADYERKRMEYMYIVV